jgi:hypothetical protein
VSPQAHRPERSVLTGHDSSEPSSDLFPALEEAYRRADAYLTQLSKDPSLLTLDELQRRTHARIRSLRRLVKKGLLLELDFGNGTLKYPSWQFEGARYSREIGHLMKILSPLSPWEQYRFFTQPLVGLGNRPPLAALWAGHTEAVRREAELWVTLL